MTGDCVPWKEHHEMVELYRQAFWDIIALAGGDRDGIDRVPPIDAVSPPVSFLAMQEVKDLKERYEEALKVYDWVFLVSGMQVSDPDDPSGGHRLLNVIEGARKALRGEFTC